MATGLIKLSTLSGIADAIRTKGGTETTYKPGEMAAAILGLDLTLDEHAVVYLNYDTVYLYAAKVEDGGTAIDPVAEGLISTPTRDADDDGTTYVYAGWDDLPSGITEEITIVTATYTAG